MEANSAARRIQSRAKMRTARLEVLPPIITSGWPLAGLRLGRLRGIDGRWGTSPETQLAVEPDAG